jgi:hypothetical protein
MTIFRCSDHQVLYKCMTVFRLLYVGERTTKMGSPGKSGRYLVQAWESVTIF